MRFAVVAAAVAAAVAFRTDTFDATEFRALGRAPRDAVVGFTAALPMRNVAELEARVLDISNPASERYTNWMTQEEVNTLIAPDAAVRARVTSFLASRGAACTDIAFTLRCTAPVAAVESIFKTEMTSYKQVRAGKADRILHRAGPLASFELPAELAGDLLFVTALYDFPTQRMRGGKSRPATPDAADLVVAVETLVEMYGINEVNGSAASIVAPAEFQADSAIVEADIKEFAKEMGVKAWNISKKVGPYSGSDTEATLDEEYIASTGHGCTQWYWTEASGVGWMAEWVAELAAAKTLPDVFSVSWGWSEQDQCTIDPSKPQCKKPNTSKTYVEYCNAGFAAATARGVSILVASGDSGAHGRNDGSCALKPTQPDWPAASPWITSVGATQLENGGTAIVSPKSPYCVKPSQGKCAGTGSTEIVCSTATNALIVSGGGFSVYAPSASWQSAAVTAYLASGALLPTPAEFNKTNRAYPDIAALGHNVIIYESGAELVDGTSCSTPMMGGIIGLANSARLAAGKKVLGFANPAIYTVGASTPAAFTDITKGDNTCTEDGCTPGCSGFGAVKGWDAVTGWGTPNVPALVAALAAL